jgi:hypothetical protein
MSAQVIGALRRQAETLEADAEAFHRNDHEVARKYVTDPSGMPSTTVTPVLLLFLAGQLRAVADEAEGYDTEVRP